MSRWKSISLFSPVQWPLPADALDLWPLSMRLKLQLDWPLKMQLQLRLAVQLIVAAGQSKGDGWLDDIQWLLTHFHWSKAWSQSLIESAAAAPLTANNDWWHSMTVPPWLLPTFKLGHLKVIGHKCAHTWRPLHVYISIYAPNSKKLQVNWTCQQVGPRFQATEKL